MEPEIRSWQPNKLPSAPHLTSASPPAPSLSSPHLSLRLPHSQVCSPLLDKENLLCSWSPALPPPPPPSRSMAPQLFGELGGGSFCCSIWYQNLGSADFVCAHLLSYSQRLSLGDRVTATTPTVCPPPPFNTEATRQGNDLPKGTL